MKNGTNGILGRIDFLKTKHREIGALLAAEHVALLKRQRRETEKLERIIGGAVRKTGAESPQFRLMIAQTALSQITDDNVRRFLADKGWNAAEEIELDRTIQFDNGGQK